MKKKRKLRIVYSIFFAIQLIVLLICYGIYCNKIITPNQFPYFGLLALIFPISFIIYLVLVGLGFFFKRKRNWVLLVLAIPLFISFENIAKLRWNLDEPKGYKLLTYNVKYGYSGFPELKDYLEDSNSDIIFLQEIYQRHWRDEAFLPNHYNAVHDYVGVSSKYPIVFDTKITLHDSNGYACMADIKIGEDTLRVFSVYLGSLRLSSFLKDMKNENEIDIERNTKIAKSKLTKGYKNHQKQLEILVKYIQESPYPVIVGGDFNSVPNSYEYYTMSKYLRDAFATQSSGNAISYSGYKFPLRIDYLFTSDTLKTNNYQVDKNIKFSDHFPAFCYVELPNSSQP